MRTARRILLLFVVATFPFHMARAEGAKDQDASGAPRSEIERRVMQDMFRRTRQMNVELRTKLAEYDRGERDERDGYIILFKLRDNYAVLREADSPDAKAVEERLSRLLEKHPDFAAIKDFRLSDELKAGQLQQKERKSAEERAAKWEPTDDVATRFYGSGNRLLVGYQYRLEFYTMPGGVVFEISDAPALSLYRSANGARSSIPPSRLSPAKTMTFQRPFRIYPPNWKKAGENILVCTDMLAGFAAITDEAREMLQIRGHRHTMPWTNRRGNLAEFCGVIDIGGHVLHKFGVSQKLPDRLAVPVGMTQDGKRAAIAVGEKLTTVASGDEVSVVGNLKEVFVWEFPSKTRRVTLAMPTDIGTLRDKFRSGEF